MHMATAHLIELLQQIQDKGSTDAKTKTKTRTYIIYQ